MASCGVKFVVANGVKWHSLRNGARISPHLIFWQRAIIPISGRNRNTFCTGLRLLHFGWPAIHNIKHQAAHLHVSWLCGEAARGTYLLLARACYACNENNNNQARQRLMAASSMHTSCPYSFPAACFFHVASSRLLCRVKSKRPMVIKQSSFREISWRPWPWRGRFIALTRGGGK